MRRWWPLFVVGVLLALAFGGVAIYIVVSTTENDRQARSSAFCAYAHGEKVYQRRDAIKNYRRIPPASRDRLVIAGITIRPRKELIDNLHERYGNKRLPGYCPQSRWPEKVPADLKRSGR